MDGDGAELPSQLGGMAGMHPAGAGSSSQSTYSYTFRRGPRGGARGAKRACGRGPGGVRHREHLLRVSRDRLLASAGAREAADPRPDPSIRRWRLSSATTRSLQDVAPRGYASPGLDKRRPRQLSTSSATSRWADRHGRSGPTTRSAGFPSTSCRSSRARRVGMAAASTRRVESSRFWPRCQAYRGRLYDPCRGSSNM